MEELELIHTKFPGLKIKYIGQDDKWQSCPKGVSKVDLIDGGVLFIEVKDLAKALKS